MTFKSYQKHWTEEFQKERANFASVAATRDTFGLWSRLDEVSGWATHQLSYALEIGYAAHDEPLFVTYVDRAIAICERAIKENWWGRLYDPERGIKEGWAEEPEDDSGAQWAKGTVMRCLAHARWLKGEPHDLDLLVETCKHYGEYCGDLSEWWAVDSAYLATLLLMEIVGHSVVNLPPRPKRRKAELPVSYFEAIEQLREKGTADRATWQEFLRTFEVVRDPNCQKTALEHNMILLEWGILVCRGEQPAPWFPNPRDVLAAVVK